MIHKEKDGKINMVKLWETFDKEFLSTMETDKRNTVNNLLIDACENFGRASLRTVDVYNLFLLFRRSWVMIPFLDFLLSGRPDLWNQEPMLIRDNSHQFPELFNGKNSVDLHHLCGSQDKDFYQAIKSSSFPSLSSTSASAPIENEKIKAGAANENKQSASAAVETKSNITSAAAVEMILVENFKKRIQNHVDRGGKMGGISYDRNDHKTPVGRFGIPAKGRQGRQSLAGSEWGYMNGAWIQVNLITALYYHHQYQSYLTSPILSRLLWLDHQSRYKYLNQHPRNQLTLMSPNMTLYNGQVKSMMTSLKQRVAKLQKFDDSQSSKLTTKLAINFEKRSENDKQLAQLLYSSGVQCVDVVNIILDYLSPWNTDKYTNFFQ
jgi:hypothetical protein